VFVFFRLTITLGEVVLRSPFLPTTVQPVLFNPFCLVPVFAAFSTFTLLPCLALEVPVGVGAGLLSVELELGFVLFFGSLGLLSCGLALDLDAVCFCFGLLSSVSAVARFLVPVDVF
jgi:hypothetical protein